VSCEKIIIFGVDLNEYDYKPYHCMKLILSTLLSVGALFSAVAQPITAEHKARAEALVAKMTLEEKIDYIGGFNKFYIRAIPRLGIPQIRMADGPQGVRNDTKSTLFPCGIAAAASWDRTLIHNYGRALGQDARARGVHIMLGPGVNIYRSPLCGRNFEYYGEDPYLASETAVAYIEGMQSEGVMATIKHFAGNNQEWNRHYVSSDIDERTLQEIYLPTFRKAVQKANVGAVMSSYNLLNSVHMTENRALTVDVLRRDWGFEGIYMSDWNATYSAIGAANGGLDLEMPSALFMNAENLLPAIANGIVSEATINEKCCHILQSLIAFGFLDREQLDNSIAEQNPYSDEVALDVARGSIVLLKNESALLPFSSKVRNVVVAGPNASTVSAGGGSGVVHPFTAVSVSEGLQQAGKRLRLTVLDEDALKQAVETTSKGTTIQSADVVVYCAGFNSHLEKENSDRTFALPASQVAEIEAISKLNKNLIVVVNSGGAVDLDAISAQAKTLIMAWYPGQEGGRAVAEILLGTCCPSGRLPISIERRAEDNPTYKSYYENVSRTHRKDIPHQRVSYTEGIFVGYRGYDRGQVEPLYPFGYGLSYTTFAYSGLHIAKQADNTYRVSFDVKNTGRVAGAEVAQLYVGDVTSSVPRPVKELKGYEKVYLKRGETKHVEITLDDEAFAFYDIDRHCFRVEPGDFLIQVGASSRDLRLKGTLHIE
jgi:beta-glucosidase